MDQHDVGQPDYGTGEKKLGTYFIGIVGCSILTLIAFWTVMSGQFARWETFAIIYSAACIQFMVQVICFLRLNTETKQGRTNILSLVFTAVIMVCIVAGSLWIMSNLNYNMMH